MVADTGDGGTTRWAEDADPQRVFEALATAYVALIDATVGGERRNPGRDLGNAGRDPDCAWGRTPVPVAEMNRVMLPRLGGPGPVDERILEIDARFGGLPYSWWLDPATEPADLGTTLRSVLLPGGLESVPAMALDLAAAPAAEQVPEIDVELVADHSSLLAAGALVAEGFGLSGEQGASSEELYGRIPIGPGSPVRVAIGRLEGQPAATALGCLTGDVLGVYSVATLGWARRRGLGRAVTLAILRDGWARGARLAVLEASEEGRPVYQRLGFREAGWFEVLGVSGD